MEIQEFFKATGAKGGRRRAETTTPEQRAEWGRKGGKLGGRGRPKEPVPVNLPEAVKGKARAKKAKARKGA